MVFLLLTLVVFFGFSNSQTSQNPKISVLENKHFCDEIRSKCYIFFNSDEKLLKWNDAHLRCKEMGYLGLLGSDVPKAQLAKIADLEKIIAAGSSTPNVPVSPLRFWIGVKFYHKTKNFFSADGKKIDFSSFPHFDIFKTSNIDLFGYITYPSFQISFSTDQNSNFICESLFINNNHMEKTHHGDEEEPEAPRNPVVEGYTIMGVGFGLIFIPSFVIFLLFGLSFIIIYTIVHSKVKKRIKSKHPLLLKSLNFNKKSLVDVLYSICIFVFLVFSLLLLVIISFIPTVIYMFIVMMSTFLRSSPIFNSSALFYWIPLGIMMVILVFALVLFSFFSIITYVMFVAVALQRYQSHFIYKMLLSFSFSGVIACFVSFLMEIVLIIYLLVMTLVFTPNGEFLIPTVFAIGSTFSFVVIFFVIFCFSCSSLNFFICYHNVKGNTLSKHTLKSVVKYVERVKKWNPITEKKYIYGNIHVRCYHSESRTRTVSYTDSDGRRRTSTETYHVDVTSWKGDYKFPFNKIIDNSEFCDLRKKNGMYFNLTTLGKYQYGNETKRLIERRRKELRKEHSHRDSSISVTFTPPNFNLKLWKKTLFSKDGTQPKEIENVRKTSFLKTLFCMKFLDLIEYYKVFETVTFLVLKRFETTENVVYPNATPTTSLTKGLNNNNNNIVKNEIIKPANIGEQNVVNDSTTIINIEENATKDIELEDNINIESSPNTVINIQHMEEENSIAKSDFRHVNNPVNVVEEVEEKNDDKLE